jgi:hypothetical protein
VTLRTNARSGGPKAPAHGHALRGRSLSTRLEVEGPIGQRALAGALDSEDPDLDAPRVSAQVLTLTVAGCSLGLWLPSGVATWEQPRTLLRKITAYAPGLAIRLALAASRPRARSPFAFTTAQRGRTLPRRFAWVIAPPLTFGVVTAWFLRSFVPILP